MKKSVLEVIHETAKDLHNAGLMDAKTTDSFDAMCLPPAHKLRPKKIKNIRFAQKDMIKNNNQ